MTGQLLTPEQIKALRAFSKKPHLDNLRHRAVIILLYHSGRSTGEIAEKVGLSQSTVRYWRNKFIEKGMQVFPADSGSSRRTTSKTEKKQSSRPTGAPKKDNSSGKVLVASAPFPRVTKKTGIKPDDAMPVAGRKIFAFQFAQLLAHEGGTLLGADIEELHDMRVASRRLRAAFDVLRPFFKPKDVRRHLKGLRATGRALGRVRDLDVFMEKAQQHLDRLSDQDRSGLNPLLHLWGDQRIKARDEMVAYLKSPAYQQFKQEFNQFISMTPPSGSLTSSGNERPELVRHVTPVLIYQYLAEVRTYNAIVKNPAIEQLHALRIAFKKLRYTVEFFSEVMGPQAREVVEEIKKLQDHLGDLNDADVACRILQEFIETWELRQAGLPLLERRNPEPVVAYLASKHAELHQLMITFPGAWEKFNHQELREKLALAISIL